jgi:inner membrane protein
MLSSTHLLFSFLFGSFLLTYAHPTSLLAKIIFAALLLIGTSLPDLDLKIPSLKHRGILHTIWPVILVLIVNAIFAKYLPFSIAALALGYGSHLFADAITKEGVAPLYPFTRQEIKGPIKVGSWAELVIATIVLAFLLVR